MNQDGEPRAFVVAALLLCLSVPGCTASVSPGYVDDDKRAAEAAIDSLHQLLNAKQYDAIIDGADEHFQSAQPRPALEAAMQANVEQYGQCSGIKDCRLRVLVGAPVEVRAVCNTTYEKGVATEMFTFVKAGEQLKLSLYKIAPGPATLPDMK